MFDEAIIHRPKPRYVPLPVLPEVVDEGLWLLPSRAREQRAIATMRACADAGQTTQGLLIEDGCKYSIPSMPSHWSRMQLAEHHELAGAIHAAWNANRGLGWYGIISDGVRPVTRNWDRLLIAASQGKNFVSCNDNWRRDSRMAGILLVPGWIVEALGYFFPPGMVHLWTDDVWEQIGQELDNWVYVEGVTVEDHHFAHPDPAKKVAFDTPREFQGKSYRHTDPARYHEWRRGGEFTEAVKRIKAAWLVRTGKEWGRG
jgi:hypothetical protein